MQTKHFLHHFLKTNRRLPELEQCNHTVYFKDAFGKYLAGNDKSFQLYQLTSHQQLVQHKDEEFIEDRPTKTLLFENDTQTRRQQKTLVFHEHGLIKSTPISCLSIKAPLVDDGNIIGIFGISLHLKNLSAGDYFSANQIVQSYFNQGITLPMHKAQPIVPELSPQERRCLRQYVHGFSANQIAMQMNLSKRTIETHLINIKNKLGVIKRHELISLSLQLYPELTQ